MQPIIHNIEQRSPEWYKLREGKITASQITNILGKDSLATTTKAIKNLAMKLAIESVHGMIENDYVSFDMQRGIDQEPSAFNALSDMLAKDFIQLDKVGFVSFSNHIGCSPDGLSSNNSTAEIKCPNAENFFKLQITEEIDQKYIDQMQHQMLCTGAKQGYFMAYLWHNNKEYHYTRIVKRDEDKIALILKRCQMVVNLKLEYIEKLTIVTIHEQNIKIIEKIN